MKILVENTSASTTGLPFYPTDAHQSLERLTLRPGMNVVNAAEWDRARVHVSPGDETFRVVSTEFTDTPLAVMAPADAVAAVSGMSDEPTLRHWFDLEERVPVRQAIMARLTAFIADPFLRHRT